ncbi:MAG: hypothetical protein GY811_01960 [Myxococcales bacterium]|nr:hypothetical protein [Myxococcales bacterium]
MLEFSDDIQIEERIDDLIERGLECYVDGDMEGALAQWKHALALDPEDERATDYLEYVEGHHDLAGDSGLAHAESTVELACQLGISTLGLAKLTDEELEDYYESIEIVYVDAEPSVASMSSIDDGWNVDDGWGQDLVRKSEPAFTPKPPEDLGAQNDIATVDVSLEPVISPEPVKAEQPGVATHVHRTSQKIRSLGGVDELDSSEEADGDDEEQEQTRAMLETVPSVSSSSRVDSIKLELEINDDEEEENASLHENPNRIGASHTAAIRESSELDLGGLELSDAGVEASIPDLPQSSPDAMDSVGDIEETIDFSQENLLELALSEHGNKKASIPGAAKSRTAMSRLDSSDLDATRQHYAIDDEMTVDRSGIDETSAHLRARTQDPSILQSSVGVDDALMSLQESIKELDLGDMGLVPPGTESPTVATSPVLPAPPALEAPLAFEDIEAPLPLVVLDAPDNARELEEIEISIGTTRNPMAAVPTIKPVEREFAHPGAAAESTDGGILAGITRDAPTGDPGERGLFIVNRLIEGAGDDFAEGAGALAAEKLCLALDYAADSAVAQKLVFENERRLVQILVSSLGDAGPVPRLTCKLTEIPSEHIDHRAAFLLTRLDLAMTLDELLDVSGMPRLEALRHLCGLRVLGYLEVV